MTAAYWPLRRSRPSGEGLDDVATGSWSAATQTPVSRAGVGCRCRQLSAGSSRQRRKSATITGVITPHQLLEIRSELVGWLDTALAHHTWDAHSQFGIFDRLIGPRRGPEDSRALRGTEIRRPEAAELFIVSAPMVDLAREAARTLPPFALQEADLPSPSGLLVFDEPPVRIEGGEAGVDSVGIAAVCWGPHPVQGDKLLVTVYLDRSEVGPLLDEAAPNRRVSEGPRLVYSFGHELVWPFGRNDDADVDHDHPLARLAPILRSVWLLMRQPSVSTTRSVALARPARRRLQRAGHTPAEVRVIELGRSGGDGAEGDGLGRTYHHQWIVRGQILGCSTFPLMSWPMYCACSGR